MKVILKILFIEDVISDAELIWLELEKNNIAFEKLLVDNKKDFLEGLESFYPDIIISDYSLPRFDGMTALKLRNEKAQFVPFILVTGSMNEEVAVECMKAGADDYIIKDNLSRLVPAINNSLYKTRLLLEKRNAENTIIRDRKLLRTLIDNLPAMIYVKDKDCRKEIANLADVKNIGAKNETEVIGKTDLELFPGLTGQRGFNEDKKIIDSGEPLLNSEEDFTDSKGNKIWLLTSKIPLVDNAGKITGLVGIGFDISERKIHEKELILAREKAEEGDRLKTAFLHNISHEIRTPMNAIVGFSALLNEPDIDNETRQSYSEMVVQSSNHLLSIITDIVEIANIEANIFKVSKNEVNLNSILNNLYKQVIPIVTQKNIKFNLESVLQDSEALIITDSTKLIQILTNLISNAIKFTDEGTINVQCKLKDNYLEFCVSDSGIGIPEKDHKRIFDRFYQVQNSTSRLYEGTGLGLSISKGYVDMLGGEIRVDSEIGKGASFYFTIPYEKPEPANTHSKEVKSKQVTETRFGKTILIAEDIESNFRLMTYFLSGTGIEIIWAENGKEAVEKCLSKTKIDLILMDLKMPVMDGYEATKTIKESKPAIPIIAQTAYADDLAKTKESGFNGFISKPFTKQQLLSVINEYL